MKRLSILLMLVALPIYVKADTINLECPQEIEKNSEFTCKITGNSNTLISGVSTKVTVSDDLTLLATTIDKRWLGDGKDGDIKIFTDDFATNSFDIGYLKLKSNGKNNTITLDPVMFYDNNVDYVKVEKVTKAINLTNKHITNNDNVESNYLVDLQISKYNIDFSKETNEYTIEINDEDHLDITPILEDDTATYKIKGNNNLKDGSKITIDITTALGDKKTYILKINKKQKSGIVETIFITILIILVAINLLRIIKNKINRGKKDGKK